MPLAPFILSPVSLTGTSTGRHHPYRVAPRRETEYADWFSEFPAYWLERPDLFAAIADGVDPEDRALRVLKWFIVWDCFY
jgi:hypothetical protein